MCVLGHPLGKEVVTFVVHHNKRGEILDVYFPHGLHAQLRKLQHLDLADAVEVSNPKR